MSDVGKAEAQAPDSEAVVDEQKPVAANDETKVEAAPEAAETEETEGETAEAPVEGAEPVETEEEKKTKSRLKREKQKAREDALKQQVADLEARLATAARNKPADDALGPKPEREKYEDEAEYQADLNAWKVEERIIARQAKAHETDTQNLRQESAAQKATLFRERAMALKDGIPDIEKIFSQDSFPVSAALAETIMETDKGPEVAHYLLRHPDEFQRIQAMSQRSAAIEVGRIEAKLALPKPRTQTQAPPPPTTLSGSARSPSKKPEDMSMSEYAAWRAKGGGE